MKQCKWHQCGKMFWPKHPRAEFCSTDCRIQRASWKQRRGSPLVDLLIAGNWRKLEEHRKSIRKEIGQ